MLYQDAPQSEKEQLCKQHASTHCYVRWSCCRHDFWLAGTNEQVDSRLSRYRALDTSLLIFNILYITYYEMCWSRFRQYSPADKILYTLNRLPFFRSIVYMKRIEDDSHHYSMKFHQFELDAIIEAISKRSGVQFFIPSDCCKWIGVSISTFVHFSSGVLSKLSHRKQLHGT